MIATAPDGKRYWEDYFSTNYSIDQKNSTLTITGKIENFPITYERHYRFSDETLEVQLTLRATETCLLTRLQENIPFASGPSKANGVDIQLKSNGESAFGISLNDNKGQGIEIRVAEPRKIVIQKNGLQADDLQIARAEIELPTQWKTGESYTLRYTLRPKSVRSQK